jgi:hypothetical protein
MGPDLTPPLSLHHSTSRLSLTITAGTGTHRQQPRGACPTTIGAASRLEGAGPSPGTRPTRRPRASASSGPTSVRDAPHARVPLLWPTHTRSPMCSHTCAANVRQRRPPCRSGPGGAESDPQDVGCAAPGCRRLLHARCRRVLDRVWEHPGLTEGGPPPPSYQAHGLPVPCPGRGEVERRPREGWRRRGLGRRPCRPSEESMQGPC